MPVRAGTRIIRVNYTVAGTATGGGTDYATLSGSVTIAANDATATITVTPVNDGGLESSETVIPTITADALYTVGGASSATVTIADNDQSTITIAATDANASETGPDTGTFTVTRAGGDQTVAVTVNYTVAGTATGGGTDYATLSGSVKIAANDAPAPRTGTPVK
ncbi:MAG: Calx-beta domain-containing protein, partial [Planctomycetota bacterium]